MGASIHASSTGTKVIHYRGIVLGVPTYVSGQRLVKPRGRIERISFARQYLHSRQKQQFNVLEFWLIGRISSHV